jgi:ABC-2 type transport system permease protein
VVGLAVALKLTLLRNGLRSGAGSTQRHLGFVAGAVGGGAVAIVGFSLLATSRGNPVTATNVAVFVFTMIALGWVVLPILTFGSDDLLDPTRLALLPLSRRDMMTLLAVSSLVGVAPVATLFAALGLVAGVAADTKQLVVAVLAVALEVAFCVVLSRVVAAGLSGLLRSRRGRDIGVALTTMVALSFQLLNPVLHHFTGQQRGGDAIAAGLARPLRWTPPGLLASTPRLVQEGRPAQAVLRLLLVAGLVAAGIALWERLVARSLVRVDASGLRRSRSTALMPRFLGPFLPAGRTGAVAAKDLRYLFRDPRRGVTQLIGVLLPSFALFLGPAYSSGSRPGRWSVFVVCLVAAFAGLQGGNRFGQDGNAMWMLLSSQTSPRDARRDLLGGDIASLLVITPLILVAGVGTAALTDGWRYLPAAFGAAGALLLVMTAGSGLVAVKAPYAVPDNPRNAFSSGGTGQGCAAGLASLVLLAAGLAACLPLLAVLLPGLHSMRWAWVLLVLGPVYGAIIGARVRRYAAQQWLRHGPDVLQTLSSSRS